MKNLIINFNPAILVKHYDPFLTLFNLSFEDFLSDFDLDFLETHEPISEFKNVNERSKEYSYGRILYFRQNINNTPIELDWKWSGLVPINPIIIDGHHRFCASLIEDRIKQYEVDYYEGSIIKVNYSGPIDPDLIRNIGGINIDLDSLKSD